MKQLAFIVTPAAPPDERTELLVEITRLQRELLQLRFELKNARRTINRLYNERAQPKDSREVEA